jgi:glycosyltransferase involved in cell wall biosynthesis/predicted metal-dependent phosphoesterase TrpH
MNDREPTSIRPDAPARVDMHCHSSASELSRLGVQRAVGVPECATPPEEVYALAKRRGMDFVTITDHDTIDGVLQIAALPDVFISMELTVRFRGEPQAVHVLCYGITPEDQQWLTAHSDDLEICAAYLHERDIVCALAHPYYHVDAPLQSRHRRRLAQLFTIWEVRNGSRARVLNGPAGAYIAALDGTGIGGSDDHAGVDIGRTWTETPPCYSAEQFLAHVRAGDARADGAQGSAAKLAHTAIALAARAYRGDERASLAAAAAPDPKSVMAMARRVLGEGGVRSGAGAASSVSPKDMHCLLRAWLSSVELDESQLIAYMQDERFSHKDLHRRACRLHERKLQAAVGQALVAARGEITVADAAMGLFESCIAAIPYAPATAFVASEQAKLDTRREDGETPRVAVVADGIGSTHGVTRVIEEIRERGVEGFEIEVVGTDPAVDRRLSAVSEFEVPHYPGLRIGVPSLSAAVQTLTEGTFDLIHVCSPGPAGIAGALVSRGIGVPLVGSYHTELTAYAGLRSGDRRVSQAMEAVVGAFYGACDIVLSPSPASDATLAQIGLDAQRVERWDRGVDTGRFDPALREPLGPEGAINVLYVGRISHEKGADLLADAFLRAHERDPRLRLVLVGGGPEEERLRARVDDRGEFLGWLDGTALARAYASADIFLFPSRTDTFGQVLLEAQASGLAVVAAAAGGPLSLIEDRVSGMLRDPDPTALADAVLELAAQPRLRERLARGGLESVAERTWERALERLAAAYRLALGERDRAHLARAA